MKKAFHVACGLLLTGATPSAFAQQNPAFTDPATYEQTIWLQASGEPRLVCPTVNHFMSPDLRLPNGDPLPGGGTGVKVGLTVQLNYADLTMPPTDGDPGQYYIYKSPASAAKPLPPDRNKVSELPDRVRYGPTSSSADDMELWSGSGPTLTMVDPSHGFVPPVISALEWARYLNVPITFTMQSAVSHGGSQRIPGAEHTSLDRVFEGWFWSDGITTGGNALRGSYQCMWDASGTVQPGTVDSATNQTTVFVPSGATFASFSYPTPTLADPTLAAQMALADATLMANMGPSLRYREFLFRNLESSITQVLDLMRDVPEYHGLLVSFHIDPEVHYPSHRNSSSSVNQLPTWDVVGGVVTASGTAVRPMVEDYHPVMIRQFAYWIRDLYGDSDPQTDSNNDGRTFWGDFSVDYGAARVSGWSQGPASPLTWEDLDAPRRFPKTETSDERTPFWHLWLNFRAEVMDDFLEEMVETIVDAGVPAERVFTHQITPFASYEQNRFWRFNTPAAKETGDQWKHIVSSRGVSGLSHYWWELATQGRQLYQNLFLRDDEWGSAEWRPIVGISKYVDTATDQIDELLDLTYETRGHVLLPRIYATGTNRQGPPQDSLMDLKTDCVIPSSTSPTLNYPGGNWTTRDLDLQMSLVRNGENSHLYRIAANAGKGSFVAPSSLQFDADETRFIVLQAQYEIVNAANGGDPTNIEVSYTPALGGNVQTAVFSNVFPFRSPTNWIVLDMEGRTGWSGLVTGLEVGVVMKPGERMYLSRIAFPDGRLFIDRLKNWTEELENGGMMRKADIGPVSIALGNLSIADFVTNNYTDDIYASRVMIYGTAPVNGNEFSDTAVVGNFEPATAITCFSPNGPGIALPGIRQPATDYLGMNKGARLKHMQLPSSASSIQLSFHTGIEGDPTPPTNDSIGDGVRFMVKVRGEDRSLVTVFDRVHDDYGWSTEIDSDTGPPVPVVLKLNNYVGQEIDLIFEVHGGSDSEEVRSVWGDPQLIIQ